MYSLTHRPWCSRPGAGIAAEWDYASRTEWQVITCWSCGARARVGGPLSEFPHWPGCRYAVVDESVEVDEVGRVVRRVQVCRGCNVERAWP